MKLIMVPFITFPLLAQALLQNLRFEYETTTFDLPYMSGHPCRDKCVSAINKWARTHVPNDINVEVATFIGTYCNDLCKPLNSGTTRQTLTWPGFSARKRRQLSQAYICLYYNIEGNPRETGVCGATTDVYTIQRVWNPCFRS